MGGTHFLRRIPRTVGVQDDLHVGVGAAGPLVRPLPNTISEARVETVRIAEEQGVGDEALG